MHLVHFLFCLFPWLVTFQSFRQTTFMLDVQEGLGEYYLTVKSACSISKCKMSYEYLLII